MISHALGVQIAELKQQSMYRERYIVDELHCSYHFSHNDYLGLRAHPRLQKAFSKGFSLQCAGSGASMTVAGYSRVHQALEQQFADYLNVDSALLFTSGYCANLAMMMLLGHLSCQVIVDKGVHASIYDGLMLAKCSFARFHHNDLNDLSKKLALKTLNPIVVTEGLFSMSGQQAPLTSLMSLTASHQAACIVDEAHAFGVLGPHGLGSVAAHKLSQEAVPLRMIAFGKAMGFQGAIVAGQGDWIEALLQYGRSHRYSTALSPALAYGLREALDLVVTADEARQTLWQLIAYFKEQIKCSALTWRSADGPIQQLQLGCPQKALHYAAALQQKGIFCQAIREPTVNRRETGLRVVLTALHSTEDIDYFFQTLHNIHHDKYSKNR